MILDKMVTTSDIAEMLGKSRGAVRTMIYAGHLPKPTHKIGHNNYWKLAEVKSWLESRKIKPIAQTVQRDLLFRKRAG
jgi:predicted DNA-binding transcriptional regulator AlpA